MSVRKLTGPDEQRESTQVVAVEGFCLTIERGQQGSIIRLTDRAGGEPLRIALGPEGPVLYVGSSLAIAVAGDLSFAAKRVAIHGQEGLELSSGEDAVVRCEGDLVTEAREQRLRARLGDVRVEANDDIKLLGERIKLNC